MINGLLTLRGAWNRLVSDPVLKFFAAALTFYGMATFEGPLLSIKSVNSLAHYTDWIIGHVHAGALGWNGFMAAAMFYWMVPRLYGTELYSRRMANTHFYLGTFGILLYVVSMWVSGVTQGLMWRAVNAEGALTYPNFVETLSAIRPMYWTRLAGGLMYLAGMFLMAWNLYKTARQGAAVDGQIQVVDMPDDDVDQVPWRDVLFGRPVVVTALVMGIVGLIAVVNALAGIFFICAAFIVAILGALAIASDNAEKSPTWHRIVEGRGLLFTVLTVIAVLIGGVAELLPSLFVHPVEASAGKIRPYRALELEGRDVYLREGCANCHSQMIRPFLFETTRYGAVSTMEDSMWDHPFQWGSKRTGPDLAREGGKYPNLWHYRHMIDPRAISPGSNMPTYGHLLERTFDAAGLEPKLRAMRSVGVPYTPQQVESAARDAAEQAAEIAADLKAQGASAIPQSEIVALIAYLQRIGTPGAQPSRSTEVEGPR